MSVFLEQVSKYVNTSNHVSFAQYMNDHPKYSGVTHSHYKAVSEYSNTLRVFPKREIKKMGKVERLIYCPDIQHRVVLGWLVDNFERSLELPFLSKKMNTERRNAYIHRFITSNLSKKCYGTDYKKNDLTQGKLAHSFYLMICDRFLPSDAHRVVSMHSRRKISAKGIQIQLKKFFFASGEAYTSIFNSLFNAYLIWRAVPTISFDELMVEGDDGIFFTDQPIKDDEFLKHGMLVEKEEFKTIDDICYLWLRYTPTGMVRDSLRSFNRFRLLAVLDSANAETLLKNKSMCAIVEAAPLTRAVAIHTYFKYRHANADCPLEPHKAEIAKEFDSSILGKTLLDILMCRNTSHAQQQLCMTRRQIWWAEVNLLIGNFVSSLSEVVTMDYVLDANEIASFMKGPKSTCITVVA